MKKIFILILFVFSVMVFIPLTQAKASSYIVPNVACPDPDICDPIIGGGGDCT